MCCLNKKKREGVVARMHRLQQLLLPAGAGINLYTGFLRGLGKLIEEVVQYSNPYTYSLGGTSEDLVNTTEPLMVQVQVSQVQSYIGYSGKKHYGLVNSSK